MSVFAKLFFFFLWNLSHPAGRGCLLELNQTKYPSSQLSSPLYKHRVRQINNERGKRETHKLIIKLWCWAVTPWLFSKGIKVRVWIPFEENNKSKHKQQRPVGKQLRTAFDSHCFTGTIHLVPGFYLNTFNSPEILNWIYNILLKYSHALFQISDQT